ncbi:MAG TPA: patatin-like phospholipase family protein [Ramlibacter sp.]|nr:patatin-like phospholipase family protein [Ramlibacter sp.]
MSSQNTLNPRGMRVVLALQGGGALGAYQAGVVQALHECRLAPDWIVGTSIGAINGAIVAGNREADRVARLRDFWDGVAQPDSVDMSRVGDMVRLANIRLNTGQVMLRGVPGFFAPRPFNPFALGMRVDPADAAFYDSTPLSATLARLVDFDYLNSAQCIRLTSAAMNVRSGELHHFDNRSQKIGPEHIRASGALPPGLPAVEIDGELYWDGGLYSNTPLEKVLSEAPQGDTLCFLIDLWSARGAAPGTFDEVRTRKKDVTFASRSLRHIREYADRHALQNKVRELYARLPEAARTDQDRIDLQDMGCGSTLHVVRIPYSGVDWHLASKEVNFSRGSITWRWEQGYDDARRALDDARWLRAVEADTAVVVHELPPRPGDEGCFSRTA